MCDVILRVRPALDLRFESPRLPAEGMYGFNSDRAVHAAHER